MSRCIKLLFTRPGVIPLFVVIYSLQINPYIFLLVGGWATPLKNMNVNWDDDIPNTWENKKNDGNQTSNQFLYNSQYVITIEQKHVRNGSFQTTSQSC